MYVIKLWNMNRLGLVIVIMIHINIFAQVEVFDLFRTKNQKKVLKWVKEYPDSEIEMDEAIEAKEFREMREFLSDCYVESVHPLVLASFYNLGSVISYYLEQEKYTDQKELLSKAMVASVRNNNISLVRKFISLGARKDSNCDLCRKANVLQIAFGNDCSIEMVDLFYVDVTEEIVSLKDCYGQNLLMYAASYVRTDKYFFDLYKQFPNLLMETSKEGRNILNYAIDGAHISILKKLESDLNKNDYDRLVEQVDSNFENDLLLNAYIREDSELIHYVKDTLQLNGYIYTDAMAEEEFIYNYLELQNEWKAKMQTVYKTLKNEGFENKELEKYLDYYFGPIEWQFYHEKVKDYILKETDVTLLDFEEWSDIEDLCKEAFIKKYKKCYAVSELHFKETEMHPELLNNCYNFFPNVKSFSLEISSDILVNESYHFILKDLFSLIIEDNLGDEKSEFPKSVYSVKELILKGSDQSTYVFPELDKKTRLKLESIYYTGGKLENVPKNVKVIKL